MADPLHLGQPAAGAATVAAISAVTVLSRWSAARISVTNSRASCLRVVSTAPTGRTPASIRDADAAVRSVGCPAWDQVPELGMELIDQPRPLRDDVVAAFVQQCQHCRRILGQHRVRITLQRGDAGRSSSVYYIVLAPTTPRQLPALALSQSRGLVCV